jgi:hypothetical protein
MKTAPRTLGRYFFTHRRLTSIPGNVLDFSGPKYQGFLSDDFRDCPGDAFPTIARETPVLLAFLRFRTLFGPPILSRFFTPFLRALNPLRT